MAGKEEKFFFCYHVLREERKSFFQYRPGLLDNRREGWERKSRAHGGSGYLRSGLVSVSDVLVLVVLTLDYRIPELSRKQKRVNPGYSDAEYGVLLHHEIGKGNSKRRKHKSVRSGTGQL